jgi:pimeloyl-ACP methyl ester carboxylesterase
VDVYPGQREGVQTDCVSRTMGSLLTAMTIEDHKMDMGGLRARYRVAGSGPCLVLLHGLGESIVDWDWVLSALAQTHRVYAPDLPGFGETAKPPVDYSPAFFQQFLSGFLDTLDIRHTTIVAHSLAGLPAVRFALSSPRRVKALILVGSAGLGREVNPGLCSLTLPGCGELSTIWGRTPMGSLQRACIRASLLFRRPERVPRAWLVDQYRLARLPGFLQPAWQPCAVLSA